jgi:putative NADH-flavin reductase
VEGYEVVAHLRNRPKLGIDHEHLRAVEGQLSDTERIEVAVRGAGAVLSALGPRGREKDRPIALGTRNIITAMKKLGTRRLIVTCTLSARDPRDVPDLRTKAMVNLVKFAMHGAYKDIVAVADLVRTSDLDWTILRLALLNDHPKTESVKVGYVGSGEVGTAISPADVAYFMLRQIGDTRYLRQAPALSN